VDLAADDERAGRALQPKGAARAAVVGEELAVPDDGRAALVVERRAVVAGEVGREDAVLKER
jgi:hypothetical protein